jgi:hypothetical protein
MNAVHCESHLNRLFVIRHAEFRISEVAQSFVLHVLVHTFRTHILRRRPEPNVSLEYNCAIRR